jgi:hypothetical protein
VNFRAKAFPVVALVALGLVVAGCGGGEKSYKAGTPAATGKAPGCSVVPADLVSQRLKRQVTGPVAETSLSGMTCTYPAAKSAGAGTTDQVQLNSDADKKSFDIYRKGLKQANNPVKSIDGYGDEAFASTVHSYADINNFAVRKGKVSVVIISTADYKEIRTLMKDILAKL